ncbi:glycyl radical protein [bacterium]|nr:glycyl radical protein [bacterium]
MNKRIKKLRTESLDAQPYLSAERAVLLTEFYKSGEVEKESVPVARGALLKYIFENKILYLGDAELIVGEKGNAPKSTPTYPEICIHSMQDLEILDSREKIPYKAADHIRNIYEDDIIPFWTGRSLREKLLTEVDAQWIDAYEAGVFTEFMEQRAPGHTVEGGKIYKKGMADFIKDIDDAMDKLDFFNDNKALDRREQLRGMRHAAEALIILGKRYSIYAMEMAATEKDVNRKKELETIARVCDRVPEHAPENFHEALQYYWFVHLGVTTELNTWDSFNPGRLDQHLMPFYKQGLDEGTLTKESATELLQAFWIKFNNQPAPPKVGVTAQESATYTDFCLINVGGVKDDGSDAVNEMTFIILDVIEEMRLLQPSSMCQVSKKNPNRFVRRAAKIIKTGFGQPSIFNTDAIIQEMVRMGTDIVDARRGGASGCVETGAFGTESYVLTGYFNIPKVFEIMLNNGKDPRTGKCIGIETGDPESFKTYDELYAAFELQLNHFIDIKIKGNRIIERLWASMLPAPFMSLLIDDCIATGTDYNAGGARYNSSYIQGVGTGTITDCLSAINTHVFIDKSISMSKLMAALKNDFSGSEDLRNTLLFNTPRYGNDDDRADDHLRRIFESFFSAVDGRPNTKGGQYRINLLPTTCHVYFGSVIGALPDGRKAGVPLSEGISPVQGADINGPTAVIKSAAKIDHLRTGGTLLNQKFTPQLLADDAGLDKLVHLIRSYFKMDGHHIQFNVVDAATLRKAQEVPEDYRDLIVRVAGYSDYFIDLSPALQEEVILRTEHADL